MLMRTTSDDLHDDQQRFENDQQHQFHISFSIIALVLGKKAVDPFSLVSPVISRNDAVN